MEEADSGTGRDPGGGPDRGALAQARRRVGPEPLRFLFDLLRGPAAVLPGRGARWHGLLACAVDGTILTVPATPANLGRFAKGRGIHGGTGYPQVPLLALVALRLPDRHGRVACLQRGDQPRVRPAAQPRRGHDHAG